MDYTGAAARQRRHKRRAVSRQRQRNLFTASFTKAELGSGDDSHIHVIARLQILANEDLSRGAILRRNDEHKMGVDEIRHPYQ